MGPGYNTIQIHPNTEKQESNLFNLSMYINTSCLESFCLESAFISTTKHRPSAERVDHVPSSAGPVLYH